MNKNSVFGNIVKSGIILGYIGLIIILILQALTPGSESSNISTNVGNKVNDVMTGIQRPEAETAKVESVKIDSVKLEGESCDPDDVSMLVGQFGTVSGSVSPDNASNRSLIYSSSDGAVVYVYQNGRILAKSSGSAIITVSSAEDESLFDSITVTVTELMADGIEISGIPDEIRVGDIHRLEAVFTPSNTFDKTVLWQSSDSDVMSVDESGYLSAKQEGRVTVTAVYKANNDIISSVELIVLPSLDIPIISAEAIELEADGNLGYIGSKLTLSAQLFPADAQGNIVWYSSDESVASVSQSGVVNCLKAGETVITAKCGENAEGSIHITVKERLSKSIELEIDGPKPNDSGYSIKQGKSGKVIATLDKDATVYSVVFSSSDENVARIGQDGVIETVSVGSALITVSTSYDGETTERSFLLSVERITFMDTIENFYYIIRKSIGHFGAFFVLGFLGSLTYYIIFKKTLGGKLASFIVNLAAGFAVAGITEILQLPYFTAGRYCSFDDVLLDFSGYCCAAIPISIIILIAHLVGYVRKKN